MTGSASYDATVFHRRREPNHVVRQRLQLAYLDLDDLPRLPGRSRRSVDFRRTDYFDGTERPLRDKLDELVTERSGRPLAGPVRMLTMLRSAGWLFNPLTTYYAFDDDGVTLDRVVLEITNTPWHERFWYLLDATQVAGRGQPFQKAFHVSPFLPMDLTYRCSTAAPAEQLSLRIALTQRDGSGREQPVFDAALTGVRVPPAARHSPARSIRVSAQTIGVSLGIYAHATGLWAERAPFHRHPGKPVRTDVTPPRQPKNRRALQ